MQIESESTCPYLLNVRSSPHKDLILLIQEMKLYLKINMKMKKIINNKKINKKLKYKNNNKMMKIQNKKLKIIILIVK